MALFNEDRQPGELISIAGTSGGNFVTGAMIQKSRTTAAINEATNAGSSSVVFAGVVAEGANLTSGATVGNIDVFITGVFPMNAQGTASDADIMKPAYIIGSTTVGTSAAITSGSLAGIIVGRIGTTKYRVQIDQAIGRTASTL